MANVDWVDRGGKILGALVAGGAIFAGFRRTASARRARARAKKEAEIEAIVRIAFQHEMAEGAKLREETAQCNRNIERVLGIIEHNEKRIGEYLRSLENDLRAIFTLAGDNREWLADLSQLLDTALGVDRRSDERRATESEQRTREQRAIELIARADERRTNRRRAWDRGNHFDSSKKVEDTGEHEQQRGETQ